MSKILRGTQVILASSMALASYQGNAADFFDDSTLTLNTRNWYSREIVRKDSLFRYNTDAGPQTAHSRTAWVQGLKLDYKSGFTDGPVGVGLDLSLYSAIALERSTRKAAGGSNRLLVEADGDVIDDWSKLGIAALKLRAGETEAKVGRHQVHNPVMSFFELRALPASFDGMSLQDKTFAGWTLQAGYFDHASPRTGAGTEKLGLQWASRVVELDWIAYAGAEKKLPGDWTASAYFSRVDEAWDRQYIGLGKPLKHGEWSTQVKLDFYNTHSQGQELAGRIRQQAYGLTVMPTLGANTLKLAVQKIDGNEWFDYVRDSNAVTLPNAMSSYFNGPNETSVQVAYIRDWAQWAPGLKTMVWHIYGWGVDGTDYRGGPNAAYNQGLTQDDTSHTETGLWVSYTLQSGALKGASLSVSTAWMRTNDNHYEGNGQESRVIFNLPVSIF